MSHQPNLGDKPPGRSASRIASFQDDYPVLYASRHVAAAVLKALLPLLGLGALAAALLQSVDWSWLEETRTLIGSWLPNIDWPFRDGEAKAWLVNTPWFDEAKWVVRQAKWIVGIVLALLVAVQEVARHRRRRAGPDRSEAQPQTEQRQ